MRGITVFPMKCEARQRLSEMPYGMLVPCSMARCDLSQLQWPEFTVPPPVPNTLKEIKLPDAIALANWGKLRAEKYFKLPSIIG